MLRVLVLLLLVLASHSLERTKTQTHHTHKLRNKLHHGSQHTTKHILKQGTVRTKSTEKVQHLALGYPSPVGDTYNPDAQKAADEDEVFQWGSRDVKDILGRFVQYDQSADTKYDEDRCGAAITIAAAVNAPGNTAFYDLITYVETHRSRPGRALPTRTEKNQINMIRDSFSAELLAEMPVTYGEVGEAEDLIYKYWAVMHHNRRDGMIGGMLYHLFVDGMKLSVPDTDAMISCSCFDSFQAGQSWPYIIHVASDSNEPDAIHWILIGKAKDSEKLFIYDPYPMDNHDPYFEEGTDGYESYKNWIFNQAGTGSGWGSSSLQSATHDIRIEGF